MTSWPEQPAEASQPPQTRRQARENERTAARQAGRRAGTSETTPAGEIPLTSSTPGASGSEAFVEEQAPAIPATAFAEPGVSSGGGSFDNLLFSAPKRTEVDRDSDASSFDLFRQAPDTSKPEPVTQPMSVLPGSSAAPVRATSPQSTTLPAPASDADSADPTGERTLTRRELRAMLQAQAANQQANHSPALAEPIVPVTFTDSAAPAGSAPVSAAAAAQQADTTVTSSPTSVFTAFGAQPAASPSAASPGPDDEEDISAQERRPFTPPTGHWSTAAELEDGAEPITSRNVGHSTAATTTNALILPSLPQADATGPLTSTGEILVTGSIDLPRTMGATGAHDRIDSSDIDRLLDSEENEFNTSEVAPVARRAPSARTPPPAVSSPRRRSAATPSPWCSWSPRVCSPSV